MNRPFFWGKDLGLNERVDESSFVKENSESNRNTCWDISPYNCRANSYPATNLYARFVASTQYGNSGLNLLAEYFC